MELCYKDPSLGDHSIITVPDQLKMQLMEENHSGSLSGHFAAKSLYDTMTRLYCWDDRDGVMAALFVQHIENWLETLCTAPEYPCGQSI